MPGLTGGGSLVRFVARGDDLLDAAKYADDIVDMAGTMNSNRWLGKAMHDGYMDFASGEMFRTNTSLRKIFEGVDSLLRPDAVDVTNKILYELKPCNTKSFLNALKQTNRYLETIGDNKRVWTVVIDLYLK